MQLHSTRLPYRQTGAFSGLILDYLDQLPSLRSFFTHAPTLKGVLDAIQARKHYSTDRALLVQVLEEQYQGIQTHQLVNDNIRSLLNEDTFTITTAHQNNLFTGPLYVIYKIVHAIKLAAELNATVPGNKFVPVFYMGTEDADLEELNHAWIGGDKLVWETRQTGAVGRMKTDKQLTGLLDRMAGQLSVLPHGNAIISLLREHFREGQTIQQATFGLLNALFGEQGLVILLPDHAHLKRRASAIFKDDLLHQSASGIVEEADRRLKEAGYKVQAHPREINLFYLDGDRRDRIEKRGEHWGVVGRDIRFSEEELLDEVDLHPDLFSPNVILRGLYQETILPNLAFIGGGGELAYWLQLKGLFTHYEVPFPVLVLRNSFLLLEKKWEVKVKRLGLNTEDLFHTEQDILNRIVKRDTAHSLSLANEFTELNNLFDSIRRRAGQIDPTLEPNTDAIRARAIDRLRELEKKMLRAERRKYSDQQQQLQTLRSVLFPGGGLQERRDNFTYYYALWGPEFLRELFRHSLALEQEFTILEAS